MVGGVGYLTAQAITRPVCRAGAGPAAGSLSAHSPHFGEAGIPEVAQRQKFGVTSGVHVAEAAVAAADQRASGAGVNRSKSAGIGGNSSPVLMHPAYSNVVLCCAPRLFVLFSQN